MQVSESRLGQELARQLGWHWVILDLGSRSERASEWQSHIPALRSPSQIRRRIRRRSFRGKIPRSRKISETWGTPSCEFEGPTLRKPRRVGHPQFVGFDFCFELTAKSYELKAGFRKEFPHGTTRTCFNFGTGK